MEKILTIDPKTRILLDEYLSSSEECQININIRHGIFEVNIDCPEENLLMWVEKLNKSLVDGYMNFAYVLL
jgi:hypothetical protein